MGFVCWVSVVGFRVEVLGFWVGVGLGLWILVVSFWF